MESASLDRLINELHGKDDHLTAIKTLRTICLQVEQGKRYFTHEPEELDLPAEPPSNKECMQLCLWVFGAVFAGLALWGLT